MGISKQEITGFFKHYVTPISVILAAVMISLSMFITSGYWTIKGSDKAAEGADTQQQKAVDLKINSNERILGDKNAKVSLIVYTDFECPYCRTFWKNSYQSLIKEYINTGKAKLVIRHFPLDFHAGAKPAAQAVECAADQGKYWELQDKIFQEQDKQGQGTIQFTKADVIKWASAIGLNTTTLTQCMDSGRYDKKITDDQASGQANGVSGTPTTFVNGQKIVGALPFETFKTAIDALLK